jgi:phosphate starvation-inducible PhoH-like protein
MTKRPARSSARHKRQDKRTHWRDDTALMRLAATNDNDARPATKARTAPVQPLNDAQRRYDAAMRTADIVFGIGPAGTGKTWLAAMRAGEALKAGVIDKIIITRPAVEAGENLGFLPGELEEKYEPYFRPVREALVQSLGSAHLEYLMRAGKIEPRPLALLRGASIDGAWILADEMQNATRTQFKLLLTRGGEGTKFIVNGDPRQTDLPKGHSGLADAISRLGRVRGIEVVKFTTGDIVRSGLTQRVVEAFENGEDTADEVEVEAAMADLPLMQGRE